MSYSVTFPAGTVKYLLPSSFSDIKSLVDKDNCVLITDNNVSAAYASFFHDYKTIILPTGEKQKTWHTIENITEQLINIHAHRKTFLIGIGGGVVTDITGFIGSIYMRGIPFGFVPTTLLGMVDAAVGGKNGVNAGLHKNLLGTIRQPEFILFDTDFLKTLPDSEWANGFAEIIKYACLFDRELFEELLKHDVHYYRHHSDALESLIATSVKWKNKIVLEDEKESDLRKLLNFGHTAGHAFETLYQLPHGHAVALGMIVACHVSEHLKGFQRAETNKLIHLLQQYQLPVGLYFDVQKVMELLKMDKKRNYDAMDYVVLNNIGKSEVATISFDIIEQALTQFAHAGNH